MRLCRLLFILLALSLSSFPLHSFFRVEIPDCREVARWLTGFFPGSAVVNHLFFLRFGPLLLEFKRDFDGDGLSLVYSDDGSDSFVFLYGSSDLGFHPHLKKKPGESENSTGLTRFFRPRISSKTVHYKRWKNQALLTFTPPVQPLPKVPFSAFRVYISLNIFRGVLPKSLYSYFLSSDPRVTFTIKPEKGCLTGIGEILLNERSCPLLGRLKIAESLLSTEGSVNFLLYNGVLDELSEVKLPSDWQWFNQFKDSLIPGTILFYRKQKSRPLEGVIIQASGDAKGLKSLITEVQHRLVSTAFINQQILLGGTSFVRVIHPMFELPDLYFGAMKCCALLFNSASLFNKVRTGWTNNNQKILVHMQTRLDHLFSLLGFHPDLFSLAVQNCNVKLKMLNNLPVSSGITTVCPSGLSYEKRNLWFCSEHSEIMGKSREDEEYHEFYDFSPYTLTIRVSLEQGRARVFFQLKKR